MLLLTHERSAVVWCIVWTQAHGALVRGNEEKGRAARGYMVSPVLARPTTALCLDGEVNAIACQDNLLH